MGYKSTPFKMAPKSPMLKALKGNQDKLPQQLQNAIKAAPESPAKQTKHFIPLEGKQKNYVKEPYQRQMGPLDKNPHKPGTPESKKYIKDYQIQHYEAQRGKEAAGIKPPGVSKTKSPAKQTKRVTPSSLEKKTVNSARQMLKKSGINNPNLTDAEVIKAAKGKGVYAEARSEAKQGLRKSATSCEYGSPAKQTTAGEFAHKKSLKDKKMGKSTKVSDKITSALEAPFSDKTYSELKKEKRAKQKAKYNAKSPAKKYKK